MYTKGGTMYWPGKPSDSSLVKRNAGTEARELMYTKGGTMYWPDKTSDSSQVKRTADTDNETYGAMLNRNNLALGAIERINVARRVQHKPELTITEVQEN